MEPIYLALAQIVNFVIGIFDGFFVTFDFVLSLMDERQLSTPDGFIHGAGWVIGLFLFWNLAMRLYLKTDES